MVGRLFQHILPERPFEMRSDLLGRERWHIVTLGLSGEIAAHVDQSVQDD